jgi:hypothetical protein
VYKEKILAFVHGLIVYDYILFASAFFLFILFIILAIVLRNRLGVALFCLLFGFATLFLLPTWGYIEMHNYLFKNNTQLISQKRLHFSDAIVVHGSLSNLSKFHFKECKVSAWAYKVTPNKYKNYIYKLKPLRRGSIVIEDIPKGGSRNFKIIIEPFTYKRDYNVSLKADCR